MVGGFSQHLASFLQTDWQNHEARLVSSGPWETAGLSSENLLQGSLSVHLSLFTGTRKGQIISTRFADMKWVILRDAV